MVKLLSSKANEMKTKTKGDKWSKAKFSWFLFQHMFISLLGFKNLTMCISYKQSFRLSYKQKSDSLDLESLRAMYSVLSCSHFNLMATNLSWREF